MKKIFSLFSFVVCISLHLHVHAETLMVSPIGDPLSDGILLPTTLEQALVLARDGDEIALDDGTYVASAPMRVVYGVTLRSVNGPDDVMIDCSGVVGDCLTVDTASANKIKFLGLTVNEGQVAMRLVNGDVLIDNMHFLAQSQSAILGGNALVGPTSSRVLIRDSHFESIPSPIWVGSGSELFIREISNSVFDGQNLLTGSYAVNYGGVPLNHAYAVAAGYKTLLEDNIFKNSRFGVYMGGGERFSNPMHVSILENRFQNIGAYPVASPPTSLQALRIHNQNIDSSMIIRNNVFQHITGVGISVAQTSHYMAIEANTIEDVHTGMFLVDAGLSTKPVYVLNNVVRNYAAIGLYPGNGIVVQASSNPDTSHVIVAFNTIKSGGTEGVVGGEAGMAIKVTGAFNNTRFHQDKVKIENNIMHADSASCTTLCAGLVVDVDLFTYRLGTITFASNNASGFDGVANYQTPEGVQTVADAMGNTLDIPPFIPGTLDLSQPFPSVSSSVRLLFDMADVARDVVPDKGAYEYE